MSFAAEIDAAVEATERAFDGALAAVMPNPVALTFTEMRLDFQTKRDLVFALDLLNEGENEAALIAGLTQAALHRAPEFDVTHLVREAWYYLRTSIDPAWQFDDGEPSLVAALSFIATVVRERVDALRDAPRPQVAETPGRERRAGLLRHLRAELAADSMSR